MTCCMARRIATSQIDYSNDAALAAFPDKIREWKADCRRRAQCKSCSPWQRSLRRSPPALPLSYGFSYGPNAAANERLWHEGCMAWPHRSAPPPPRGVLLRRTSKSASSIRFFSCEVLSCRPLFGARSFSFPSSSTKAARTKRRPRRPPQKEPGSGRDAIISIVVVVVVVSRAGRSKL